MGLITAQHVYVGWGNTHEKHVFPCFQYCYFLNTPENGSFWKERGFHFHIYFSNIKKSPFLKQPDIRSFTMNLFSLCVQENLKEIERNPNNIQSDKAPCVLVHWVVYVGKSMESSMNERSRAALIKQTNRQSWLDIFSSPCNKALLLQKSLHSVCP